MEGFIYTHYTSFQPEPRPRYTLFSSTAFSAKQIYLTLNTSGLHTGSPAAAEKTLKHSILHSLPFRDHSLHFVYHDRPITASSLDYWRGPGKSEQRGSSDHCKRESHMITDTISERSKYFRQTRTVQIPISGVSALERTAGMAQSNPNRASHDPAGLNQPRPAESDEYITRYGKKGAHRESLLAHHLLQQS